MESLIARPCPACVMLCPAIYTNRYKEQLQFCDLKFDQNRDSKWPGLTFIMYILRFTHSFLHKKTRWKNSDSQSQQ